MFYLFWNVKRLVHVYYGEYTMASKNHNNDNNFDLILIFALKLRNFEEQSREI